MKKVFTNTSMVILIALVTLGSACTRTTSEMQPTESLKWHAFLKIDSQLIADHIAVSGQNIILEFKEQNDTVGLEFIGFDADGEISIQRLLRKEGQQPKRLKNIYYGQFRNNEANTSIQSIITAQPIRNWYLRPKNYKDKQNGKYVAYELRDNPFPADGADTTADGAKASLVINPSPPCCM